MLGCFCRYLEKLSTIQLLSLHYGNCANLWRWPSACSENSWCYSSSWNAENSEVQKNSNGWWLQGWIVWALFFFNNIFAKNQAIGHWQVLAIDQGLKFAVETLQCLPANVFLFLCHKHSRIFWAWNDVQVCQFFAPV